MVTKNLLVSRILGLILGLGLVAQASAVTVSVKCEVRSSRSKISIDGKGFSGAYYAIAYSGTSGIRSKLPNKVGSSSNGYEVEFDFDSNSSDIAAGATKIPYNFIKNRTVYGHIRRASDNILMSAMKATCIAK